jgi:hypothetical protein
MPEAASPADRDRGAHGQPLPSPKLQRRAADLGEREALVAGARPGRAILDGMRAAGREICPDRTTCESGSGFERD